MTTAAPTTPIGDVAWRDEVSVQGTVRSMRLAHAESGDTLELTVFDDSGGLTVVFTGRSEVPGIDLGTPLHLRGRAGARRGSLALVNPQLRILPRSHP